MFPRPERPHRPAEAWLNALRRGLDLVVAFATLRDAELPPDDGDERADRFTTGDRTRDDHPHRQALRAPARARRPGAVRLPEQHCTTPLAARRVARSTPASRSGHA